jgi:excisionase family DNA binding protein
MKPNTPIQRSSGEFDRATFTVNELASHIGISTPMVYRMLKSGEIPRRKAGKKYIIPKSAVAEWLRNTSSSQNRRER